VRPRLAAHVFARRHLARGERLVVLHDTERLVQHHLSERSYAIVAAMDGTRDGEGLVAAAARAEVRVARAEVEAFVAELGAHALLVDGSDAVEGTSAPRGDSAPLPSDDASRPIARMPGFALLCDGRGSCCRFYPTIAFTPEEATRARARLPLVREAGGDEARAFTPLAGDDRRLLAVALDDGRCAYLDADDRCGIHRAGRSDDKPLGCRTYPARFIDDGLAVRAGPLLECACVFASAWLGGGAEPLLDPGLRARGDIDPAIVIERLSDAVLVAPGRTAPVSELARFAATLDPILALDRSRSTLVQDGAAALWSLADALDAHGLDAERTREALASTHPPEPAAIRGMLDALAPRVRRLLDDTWRSDRDLARQTAHALDAAIALLDGEPEALLAGPGRYAADEAFYVRALVFGHHLVHREGRRPMSLLARDRALRAVLGRALGVVARLADLGDPAFERPLALVEAAMRAYGLSAYLRDLEVAS
jgi:lysine-N-methylase